MLIKDFLRLATWIFLFRFVNYVNLTPIVAVLRLLSLFVRFPVYTAAAADYFSVLLI